MAAGMRGLVAAVAVATFGPTMLACSSDDEPPETSFAEELCDVFADFGDRFSRLRRSGEEIATAPVASVQDARRLSSQIDSHFSQTLGAIQAAEAGLADVDGTDVDQGQPFLVELRAAFGRAADHVQAVRDDLAADPVTLSDPQAAADQLRAVPAALGQPFVDVFAALAIPQFQGLVDRISAVERCQDLGRLSGGAPPAGEPAAEPAPPSELTTVPGAPEGQ